MIWDRPSETGHAVAHEFHERKAPPPLHRSESSRADDALDAAEAELRRVIAETTSSDLEAITIYMAITIQAMTMGHTYIGHNYIGHNYMGQNYMGHQYVGHSYIVLSSP